MTNRIDNENPQANMYGVLPCPKCGSHYRWPSQPVHPQHPDSIICDDCGWCCGCNVCKGCDREWQACQAAEKQEAEKP